MIILNDLDDSDAELHASLLTTMIQLAETWSMHHFNQASAKVWEVAQVPIPYPHEVAGYRVMLGMPQYPHGKGIEILLAPDLSMSARDIP